MEEIVEVIGVEHLKTVLSSLTPEEIVIAIKKKIMSIENAEKYPPFAGVLLYFLRRELNGMKEMA